MKVLSYSLLIFHSKCLTAGLEAPPSAPSFENCSNYFQLRSHIVIGLIPLCYSIPLWTYQLQEVLQLSFPFQAFAILSAFEREVGLGFGSEAGEKLTFKDSQCENICNFLLVKVQSGMWLFKVFQRCSYKTPLFTFRVLVFFSDSCLDGSASGP